jgi:hypothetical protein
MFKMLFTLCIHSVHYVLFLYIKKNIYYEFSLCSFDMFSLSKTSLQITYVFCLTNNYQYLIFHWNMHVLTVQYSDIHKWGFYIVALLCISRIQGGEDPRGYMKERKKNCWRGNNFIGQLHLIIIFVWNKGHIFI